MTVTDKSFSRQQLRRPPQWQVAETEKKRLCFDPRWERLPVAPAFYEIGPACDRVRIVSCIFQHDTRTDIARRSLFHKALSTECL